MQQHENSLKIKQDELTTQKQNKINLIEKIVNKEAAIKKSSNRLLLFDTSNNKNDLSEAPAQYAMEIQSKLF